MKIIKKVQIKQVVTQESKTKLHRAFTESKMRLEQECQQLLFEQRKLLNKKGVSKQEITRRFQEEINKRQEKMKAFDFKLEQLEALDLGSEITEREVEALVEVSEGAHWNDIMGEQAVVIQDDIVIRIDK